MSDILSSYSEDRHNRGTNLKLRRELTDSVLSFMLGVAHIIKDQRLIEATNMFWEPVQLDNDRLHSFSFEDAGSIAYEDWARLGEFVVPNSVLIVLDDAEVKYSFGQDVSRDDFNELTLTVNFPRDSARCAWNASLAFIEGDDTIAYRQPTDGVMTLETNSDFALISSALQTALLPARFTREIWGDA